MIQQDHLQIFDLTLKPQSPLFIGSGKKYSKKEYLYSAQQKTVRLIDHNVLFELLVQRGCMDAYEKFMLSENTSLWEFLTGTCGLTDTELNQTAFNGIPLVRYQLSVSGYDVAKELHPFQRDAYGRAYIPGSSLKGALRTVWLFHALSADPAGWKARRNSDDFCPIDRKTNEPDRRDNKAVFPEKRYTNQLRHPVGRPNDMLDSIFRGIQVSDSLPIPNEQMVLTGRTLISPKSAAVLGENFDGHPKDLPLYQECVRPGAEIHFQLTLDQSILQQHTHPITAQTLLDAIQEFDVFYRSAFEELFPSGRRFAVLPQQPHLILGGGTGYFSKTLVYPYLGQQDALRWVQAYMMRKFKGKHEQDDKLGISPHRMRYLYYEGKLYPAGFCGVSIT